MNIDVDIDLHSVISDLSQKVASLTQENAILKAVVRAQQDAMNTKEQKEDLTK